MQTSYSWASEPQAFPIANNRDRTDPRLVRGPLAIPGSVLASVNINMPFIGISFYAPILPSFGALQILDLLTHLPRKYIFFKIFNNVHITVLITGNEPAIEVR